MTAIQEEQIAHMRMAGESYGKIADSLNISVNTVKSFCRRKNIYGGKGETNKTQDGKVSCAYCGEEVPQPEHRKAKRFCSDACRVKWWNRHRQLAGRKNKMTLVCRNCGREFSDYGSAGRKYCCHGCYVAARFKGGGGDE